MHVSTLRFALCGAALAAVAGSAMAQQQPPATVDWEKRSMFEQHRNMPSPLARPASPSTAVMGAGSSAPLPPPEAAQAIQVGDTVRLVSQEEYARLRSNPQALGGPPAPEQPGASPAAPATK